MKYSKDGAFEEPVVRCDSCTRLILVALLRRLGMCPDCSNTRVRNVRTLNDADQEIVKKWIEEGKVPQDWFDVFEPVDVEQ